MTPDEIRELLALLDKVYTHDPDSSARLWAYELAKVFGLRLVTGPTKATMVGR